MRGDEKITSAIRTPDVFAIRGEGVCCVCGERAGGVTREREGDFGGFLLFHRPVLFKNLF